MLILVLFCAGLTVTSFNLVAIGVAIGLWLFFHPLLIWMSSVDPYLLGIYLRNINYPGYIPAFTTPFRKKPGYKPPAVNKSWKGWNR